MQLILFTFIDWQFFDIVEGRKMVDFLLVQAFAYVLGLILGKIFQSLLAC